ncbi:MAG TPA: N-acetylmuramoyl-L-alanine amidase-like domain-containing protein [Terriglobia bacterium]|nr:N-acetylmuramoyl-L-alanine amidase-like domain-containing protein [Terriglobia bacterium]
MKRAKTPGRREVEKILKLAGGSADTPMRVERISGHFVGCPYQIGPLIGSADRPEVFVASLTSFDCVTYMETVLSLAEARTPQEFERRLCQMRYRSGAVEWRKRNHYMVDWIRNNGREGLVREVTLGPKAVVKTRTLNVVPGLPSEIRTFRCFPKRIVRPAHSPLESGDLIFFASTRPHLDIFHCGLIVKKDGRDLLRHASRSQGGVVEQSLLDFLKKNRMAGIIVARPQTPRAPRKRS